MYLGSIEVRNRFVRFATREGLYRACGGCNNTIGSRCVFNIKKS